MQNTNPMSKVNVPESLIATISTCNPGTIPSPLSSIAVSRHDMIVAEAIIMVIYKLNTVKLRAVDCLS